MITKKTYIAYSINTRKGTPDPSVEKQLAFIYERYNKRFGVYPTEHFLGPISMENGQVLVKQHEVWIELPERTRTFNTAYPKKE